MFQSRHYQSESLIEIVKQYKYQNNPELYFKKQIIVTQRDLIQQILYLISGLETSLFIKIYDEVQFNSQKQEVQKIFHYGLRTDIVTTFTHLSYQTIKSCTQSPLKIANLIHYLDTKSKHLYQRTNNIILRSFAEGLIQHVKLVGYEFTAMLSQFQKQNANIACISNQIIQRDEYKKLTLLKITHIFDDKILFLTQIVGTLSKILPYSVNNSTQPNPESYLSLQILFDQFSKHMNSIQLNSGQKQQILKIFQNSLLLYTNIIQNWLEMNPFQLKQQKSLPFFIKLQNIDFKTQFPKQFQNFEDMSLASHSKNFALNNRSAGQDKNCQQFVQLFFKLDNLLVEQYLPSMFKKQAQCILELGKIIQFIYLYFSTQEKSFLSHFFNVKTQFIKMYELIRKQSTVSNNKNQSMFLNNQALKNRKKPLSLSSRMHNSIQNKSYSNGFKQINSDLTYKFIQYQNFNKNFRDQKNLKQYSKYLTSSTNQPAIKPTQSNHQRNLSKIQNFSIKFQRLLSQIIQKLYSKALFFFQQKSQRQFFKLTSHANISQISQFRKTSFFPSAIGNNSMKMIEQSLQNIQDTQRIISSISITLIGIKKFMLFEQGDFFIQFISLINNLFQNSHQKISKNLIKSYIQQAIKSSSANDLPNNLKQKVSFIFLKKIKDQQIKQLKVWNVFSMVYKPSFPVNCIFNDQIMQNFGQVFNFIFIMKKCQYLLKNVWEEFKQNAKIQTQYSMFQTKKHPFQSKILAIRNNVHHFINVIFGFIMISIQSQWQQYINQINCSFSNKNSQNQFTQQKRSTPQKLHNPISLIQLTLKLQKNLKNLTTQNLSLSNTMILINELLEKYKKLLKIQPQSKDWNQVIYKQQIQYIEHEFLGIMDIAKNIQGVGEAICYNYEVR